MPTDDDRLLDAASRALALDPACGMGAIAKAAGVSRATLHRHFPTRACLEGAIIDRSMARLGAITEEIEAQELTGRAALEALVPRAFPIAEAMAFALASPSLQSDPDLLARADRFHTRWTAWVEAGQRRGEIRVDVPARWVIEALHGLGHAALFATAGGLIAPRDAQRLMLITLLDGVREPAGPTAALDRSA